MNFKLVILLGTLASIAIALGAGWHATQATPDQRLPLETTGTLRRGLGGTAYVRDNRGNTANVGTREHTNGTKYLQTYADKVWSDNLLALPECRWLSEGNVDGLKRQGNRDLLHRVCIPR